MGKKSRKSKRNKKSKKGSQAKEEPRPLEVQISENNKCDRVKVLEEQIVATKQRKSSKIVRPQPGFCLKVMLTSETKHKLFINVCHTKALPAPKEMDEDRLLDSVANMQHIDYKLPLSLSQPRDTKDKMGRDARAVDVAINSDFFERHIQSQDGVFFLFLVYAIFETLEKHFGMEIEKSKYTVLSKSKTYGELSEHKIYCSDDLQVNAKGEPAELPSASDDDDEETASASLPEKNHIAEIASTDEPEHILFFNEDKKRLIAEFYMPRVKNINQISFEANDDRLRISETDNCGYFFDKFLPCEVRQSDTAADFDEERKILRVVMTVKRKTSRYTT